MASSEASFWAVIGFLILLQGHNVAAQDEDNKLPLNIGVFVDLSTRIGSEQKIGIEIAAEDFNKTSDKIMVKLHFQSSSSSKPLQEAYSAIQLIKEKKMHAIITGRDHSEEAALLGDIGNQYKVPVFSISASLPLHVKTPSFFVQMTNDYASQMKCITSLVQNFGWKNVIAVYEDDGYGSTTSSMLDTLSLSLQDIGSRIEDRLAFPPVAFMPHPKEMIRDELIKVLSMQSRVFVVLHSSITLAHHLFKEAKNMGLMGRETAWIISDSIGNILDTLNSSTISHMEGFLGIRTYYDEYNQNFTNFNRKFISKFVLQYPDDASIHPGIHALIAYDTMATIGNTFESYRVNHLGKKTISTNKLWHEMSLTKFTGLSGQISIQNGRLEKDGTVYRIVNVVGNKYKELEFWTPENGFFMKFSNGKNGENSSGDLNKKLNGMVNWPGDIKHIPKGWTMPSTAKPLKIGLPGIPPFQKFVVHYKGDKNKTIYTGFSIDVFLEAVKIVEENYGLPYEFELYNGTYDELVDRVIDKTYDAVVGDVTILANRSKFVDFTQPYTKPGLVMIVPLKPMESNKARMLMKPFSWQLWLFLLGTLLYIVFVVGLIESRNTNNSEFEGRWTNRISVALWFTLSSIFFAHKENIRSNLTRMTLAAWFFVIFVLISSYTASLTSILTVPLLEPNKVKDVEWLRQTNSSIGCDGGSVLDHLVDTLNFNPENIMNIDNQYDYEVLFNNGSIVAVFLERPYQKFLVNERCKSFSRTKETFTFGGQGFSKRLSTRTRHIECHSSIVRERSAKRIGGQMVSYVPRMFNFLE
ncbi:glutamate receptor 2.7 isoform X2 [Beta vulgaris subsp. vulgaris]|uniref:glutamate receptor 2.7 isoform X2 n=1 Tax=Beta vulgaris subsp. vulgaris TaxID=3555 RepID=UPI00053FE034|nr:glutamate receptor 2.7 isoform X2 [Beta vulgaris subsp. vulgaris]